MLTHFFIYLYFIGGLVTVFHPHSIWKL